MEKSWRPGPVYRWGVSTMGIVLLLVAPLLLAVTRSPLVLFWVGGGVVCLLRAFRPRLTLSDRHLNSRGLWTSRVTQLSDIDSVQPTRAGLLVSTRSGEQFLVPAIGEKGRAMAYAGRRVLGDEIADEILAARDLGPGRGPPKD